MRRISLATGIAIALVLASQSVSLPRADAAASTSIGIKAPATAKAGLLTAITLTLPGSVAAVDGRVLVDAHAASLMGVAIHGHGTGMLPVAIRGGFAFGAYGMKAKGAKLVLDLVLLPKRSGHIDARVIVDAVAGRYGARLDISGSAVASVAVGHAARTFWAPAAMPAMTPTRPASAVAEALPDGRIDRRDLDVARADWEWTRQKEAMCGRSVRGDVNDDGCTDVVDLQATLAAHGRHLSMGGRGPLSVAGTAASAVVGPAATLPATNFTFTVNSTADTPDVLRGDGICADSQARCTLRAAIAEADYDKGNDRIEFNVPGGAPAVIQLGSRLPYITSRLGTLTIDGYTQPGSRPNDLAVGSDAVIGVDIRGNGVSANEVGIYITSPGNTVRGLALGNLYRGVFMDGADAHDNRVIGDWIGFGADGSSWPFAGYGVLLNTGAHDNLVGTPDLADRNVIGNWTAAIDSYGPGTDRNVVQNNQLCIAPNGSAAICNMGIDHNFGPKDGTVGGDDPFQKNVIGPTYNQGIELSHGWDPAKVDFSGKYSITGNKVTGNWVGFRMNGSYDANYRSGIHFSSSDNGNGINCYDGSNNNIIQRNFVASVYDGIQLMAPNAQGNIARGNIIGIAPSGQNAPLTGWGIKVRWGTRFDIVANNTISNAAAGGIGLVSLNNQGQPMSLAYNIRLSHNIITRTNGPAIFLAPDPTDPTSGANALLPAPTIDGVSNTLISGKAVPGASVEVYRASRVAGDTGLPIESLGDAMAAGDGSWTVTVSGLQAGDRVTALQIAPDDNTSALAVNVPVNGVILPPPPPDPLAIDDFQRTSGGTWGDAVVGGTWNYAGTQADFSVSGGQGRVSTAGGQTREARLSIGAGDVVQTGTISFDRVPVGGNAFAYLLARQNGSSAYRASVREATTGAIYVQLKRAVNGVEANITGESLVPGLNASSAAGIAFRFSVVADQLKLRLWAAGGAEPSSWSISGQDATSSLTGGGGVGIRTYTSGSVSNAPVVVSLDDFAARLP